ncbi:MAG: carbohydrate binding family 9 domain-containing protein, partial [Myxococcota bacterium]
SAAAQERRTLEAAPREGPLTIDGVLDEAAWGAADETADFTERRPTPGATPPVQTRFRVLYDQDALYFGVVSELGPGERPRMAELTRDTFRLFDDDTISIKVDVRRDRRNTVGFAVNAAGAWLDYVAIDNGRQFRVEYDAVWEVTTTVREDAWVAEFRIPIAALGLGPGEGERILGLNVTRDHNAARGTYDWNAIPVEFGAVSAIHYGDLEGIEGIAGGRPLILVPFALAGWREDDERRFPFNADDSAGPLNLGAGLDARLRIGVDSWAELTVLTDFAEVDLDDPTINLDRFPLFFPERRPFFLTGLDVFDFGAEGVAQPFFTRRVGLDADRREVPIWGGLRSYGRVPVGDAGNSLGYGLLQVFSGQEGATTESFSVARLRANIGEASYVGGIATVRSGLGAEVDGDPNLTVGTDFVARLMNRRLEIGGFASGTFNDAYVENLEDDPPDPAVDAVTRGAAGNLYLRWRGERWRPRMSLLYVDESYDPAIGFVQRRDILRADGTLQYQHRTRRFGLEAIDVYLVGTQILDGGAAFDPDERDAEDREDPRVLDSFGRVQLDVSWVQGWFLFALFDVERDVVRQGFDLRRNVDVDPACPVEVVDGECPGGTIAAGRYVGARGTTGIRRSDARNPGFTLEYTGETAFFGNPRHNLRAELNASLTTRVRLQASGSASFARLHGESFRTASGTLQMTLAPTRFLQADAVVQVNSFTRAFTTLARVRWRYLPGSDLFLVYQQNHPYASTDARCMDQPESCAPERRAILKLTFRYDALL